jgi:hypothetical protein
MVLEGAVNIRQTVLPNLVTDGDDRDTAGWHSQWFACSTVVRVCSPRENRLLTAIRTIPTRWGILAR